MSDQDQVLFDETAERLFAAHGASDAFVRQDPAETLARLWEPLEESGVLSMLMPEQSGGIGADASSFAGVLRIAGRHGAPGPLAETMIARWLTAQIGVPCPKGSLTLAVNGWSTRAGVLSGQVRRGPNPTLDHTAVIHLTEGQAILQIAPVSRFSSAEGNNIAGEPFVELSGSANGILRGGSRCTLALAQRIDALLSLGRAALMIGALENVMNLSLSYASERVQFGRPIAQFQAVQQQLASLAGAVAAATAITFAAARAMETGSGSALLDAARIRVADAGDSVSAIAHQVHGAIGITREYSLQHFTRRLWAWRNEAMPRGAGGCPLAARFSQCSADELWSKLVEVSGGAA